MSLALRYNLNSVTDKPPSWIGAGFLSMTISQAEAEGKHHESFLDQPGLSIRENILNTDAFLSRLLDLCCCAGETLVGSDGP